MPVTVLPTSSAPQTSARPAQTVGAPVVSARADLPRADAIDRVLARIDARVQHQRRMTLQHGETTAISRGSVTLVYVIDGTVTITPQWGPGEGHLAEAGLPIPDRLAMGDAMLFSDGRARSLRADQLAHVLVSRLDFTESATQVLSLLPSAITVRDLLHSDPAVAALAAALGPGMGEADDACSGQPGSSVVCQMMSNTVLVSVVRAWAVRGCAPDGWPSVTHDPFLDRVVEAIHAEPGRNWTLEALAQTGAMSRSVFAQRFRSAIGVSPANYLAEVRIRSAQNLLTQGCGVSEVSRAMGYGSDDGFRRAFKRYVGQTPSAWRAGTGLPTSG